MQVTPSTANAMDGRVAATPSEQMKIERTRILISPIKLGTANSVIANYRYEPVSPPLLGLLAHSVFSRQSKCPLARGASTLRYFI